MRVVSTVVLSAALISIPSSFGQRAPAAPKLGIKTPGVQIPFAKLKAEFEFPISGTPASLLVDRQVWMASSSGVLRIDPQANKAADTMTALNKPCLGLAVAFGSVWAPVCGDQALARLDPKTGKVSKSIPTGAGIAESGIAATGDSIWMLTDGKAALSRIDPLEDRVVAEMRLPDACRHLLAAENMLWVTCPQINKLLRIDPRTNLVTHRVEVPGQPGPMAFGENSIWILCQGEGKVARLDPKQYEPKPPEPRPGAQPGPGAANFGGFGGPPPPAIATPAVDPKLTKLAASIDLKIPNGGGEIAFGEGSLWVTSAGFPITRIDPESEKVVQQFWGEGGGMIRVGLGSVWLVHRNQGKLLRLDPRRIAATLAE